MEKETHSSKLYGTGIFGIDHSFVSYKLAKRFFNHGYIFLENLQIRSTFKPLNQNQPHMKKISTLVAAVLFAGASFAQSQRLVLVEEFTQASCGPCATQNPAFNTLLGNNPTKVTSIKYQTSWPGVDPMNAQNPTDVATRVTYYNVSGVPHGTVDGKAIVNDCSAYTGAPMCLSQTEIDNQYNVTTPFTLGLTHTMSTDYDSAYVSITITASGNYTATGPLKLHLAMIEKTITFTTAPGTNGETVFYNVMRKMYPSASGTTLAGTWTTSQTQTFTFNVALPSYIYNRGEVAFVAFIEDDFTSSTTRTVLQSAYSAPIPIANDAGVTTMTGLPVQQCTSTFTPSITLTNAGSVTLTSCDINMQVDLLTPTVFAWTGSLAPNGTTTVVLPQQTATGGSHTFTVWTSNPNGITDYNPSNDQTVKSFVINSTPLSAPITEGYQPTLFPPPGWALDNPSGPTWTRRAGAGGFGQSTACAKMDFYNSPANNVDQLYMPIADLTSLTTANLIFNVAYAQYSSENDKLEVKVSTDCGVTWTTVYNKAGATLKTANPTTSAFLPTSTQWRNEIVNLNAYAGQNNVLIKFTATSAYGNNLYIDDINLTNATGIEDEDNGNITFNVYPNPFSGTTTFNINLLESSTVGIDVYNIVGEKVTSISKSRMNAGENNISFDGSNLPSGVYFVTLVSGNQSVTKKIAINK